MYALITDNIVVNIILADAEFAASIENDWDFVVPVLTPESCGIGWGFNNGEFIAPPPEAIPELLPKPYLWFIDKGPFNDRFGAKKLAVLMSADPVVKAFNSDKSDREYIDLQRADVQACVMYLAGVAIPGIGTMASPILTVEEATAILQTPVEPAEQNALVRKFF